ncbi:MAG: twin-arginine translocation signal domain-containing protein [Planctomycetes bacterium]|nr:twin-arginine translocation signal domain-containing protein [Planctomycetota bacterium]
MKPQKRRLMSRRDLLKAAGVIGVGAANVLADTGTIAHHRP